jgi:Tfp pilus assembly protein PilE
VGTIGIALVYVLIFFLAYLFSQSAFISYIKGTAVKLSHEQFPDLYERYLDCCQKLGIDTPPDVYLLHGDGIFNAFATRFLGRSFVVLLSDLVDSMNNNPEGVNFYIGHELGHIRMKHLTGHVWRLPCLWLPLLGAAYSRAKESTCDLHGLACCDSKENAARAMVALAAGAQRWSTLDMSQYIAQATEAPGFWMSYHELCGSYPWLSKRVARVSGFNARLPRRNASAYLLAFFTPNVGRIGGGAGPLVFVAIIGILAAIALPAYQQYVTRAKLMGDLSAVQPVTSSLSAQYEQTGHIPSLVDVAAAEVLPTGASLSLDPKNMVLYVSRKEGGFAMVPQTDSNGHVTWNCKPDGKTAANSLPKSCR